MSETLHDQHGPYGTTPDDLREWIDSESGPARTLSAAGWVRTAIEYRKEMHWTGRYRCIAYVTYEREV